MYLTIEDAGPNTVFIEAHTPSPGFLVLRDTYYPGWIAFVDGVQTEIQRADYLFRAVYLSEGSHRVVFPFRPLSVKLGAVISLLSLLSVAMWWFVKTGLPSLTGRAKTQ